jgi:S-adenosylmethionine uptake transporter
MRPSRQVLPFAAGAAGIATFAAMDGLMKGAASASGAFSAMLWRCCIASLIVVPVWRWRGGRLPDAAVLRLHLLRSAVVAAMAVLFFWGLVRTPMAEAIALSFIAPLIALYLAAATLGEKVSRSSLLASLLGLAGVAVIVAGKLGAGFAAEARWGAAAILLSAVLYAWNLVLQRRIALLASPLEVALFQSTLVFLVLALFAPWLAVWPAGESWLLLAGAAVLSLVSLVLLSWAYGRAEAQALVPIEYSAFLWAALIGWIAFGEAVTWATLAGAVLIVAGCLIAARRVPPEQVAL